MIAPNFPLVSPPRVSSWFDAYVVSLAHLRMSSKTVVPFWIVGAVLCALWVPVQPLHQPACIPALLFVCLLSEELAWWACASFVLFIAPKQSHAETRVAGVEDHSKFIVSGWSATRSAGFGYRDFFIHRQQRGPPPGGYARCASWCGVRVVRRLVHLRLRWLVVVLGRGMR